MWGTHFCGEWTGDEGGIMVKKAAMDLTTKAASGPTMKPAMNPTVHPIIHVDARIAVGMFFALTGTILAAFGLSTRDHPDMYAKSLGIDANLWWGLALLAFGIVVLAFGRRGQGRMEKGNAVAPAKPELRRHR
jgi:hypothetical protein